MLEIRNLQVSISTTEILKGINLNVQKGEVHAVMGPNGSGKSTLANVLAGRPEYEVTHGAALFEGQDLLGMTPDERARRGIFLAFQYPVELPGVRNRQFLKAALDSVREHRGEDELSVRDFNKIFDEAVQSLEIDPELIKRSVNEGFSGGEKKRSEMLQLSLLNPKLALLDETDSGLDIDALKTISKGINRHRNKHNAILLITHYQRILNYITPNQVHVLIDGSIAMSGGEELAKELEAKGYDWVKEDIRS
ncbi:MAG: Fe-S cluster assembly ATPase SufC [SAR202 cluster bacterium]|jgi:Fe-S cluster assembly ATP-binding protein|nr:Fe-S cluster assembly ATPase SufC [SAR202 cluster bacterium]